jgi:hypothetical protein
MRLPDRADVTSIDWPPTWAIGCAAESRGLRPSSPDSLTVQLCAAIDAELLQTQPIRRLGLHFVEQWS